MYIWVKILADWRSLGFTITYGVTTTCAPYHSVEYRLCRQLERIFSLFLSIPLSLSVYITHTHTRASCIWTPSTTVHPKAPWEICKLADAQCCPSCSPDRSHSHAELALGPGRLVKACLWIFTIFNADARTNTSAALQQCWKWAEERSSALSAGTKVISFSRAHTVT